MSIQQKVRVTPQVNVYTQEPRRRFFVLCGLCVCAIIFAIVMRLNASNLSSPFVHTVHFLDIWWAACVPYLLACLFVLRTPPPQGRWMWREMSVILMGALLQRLILLPTFPFLSHDILRYLWDAQVTTHGYSPFTTLPDSPALRALRDPLFYAHMGYQNVPTLYPPGAQVIYLISYLLAGKNITVLKAIFLLFDMTSCIALAFLLQKRGLDPRRCIIYAWAPLVITEFAIQGHVDVLPITFSILAILCASSSWRGSRALTGFLIGMATVTKLYPILLLVVVIRRRDYALLATCILTIAAFYTPYIILGHGNVFGFFSTYLNQQATNEGVVPLFWFWFSDLFHIPSPLSYTILHLIDVLIAASVSLLMLYLRWRERVSMEMAFLILMGMIFFISSHIFPWYTTILLPWLAVLMVPLRQWAWHGQGVMNHTPTQTRMRGWQISGKAVALVTTWYFTFGATIGYFFIPTNDWRLYYALVYDVTLLGLAVAATLGIRHYYALETRQGTIQ